MTGIGEAKVWVKKRGESSALELLKFLGREMSSQNGKLEGRKEGGSWKK